MAERKTHVVENGKLVPDEFHPLWHAHPAKIHEEHEELLRKSGPAGGIPSPKDVLKTKKEAIKWLDDYAAGLIQWHPPVALSTRRGQWRRSLVPSTEAALLEAGFKTEVTQSSPAVTSMRVTTDRPTARAQCSALTNRPSSTQPWVEVGMIHVHADVEMPLACKTLLSPVLKSAGIPFTVRSY
jgi:hypothetical protein